MRTTLLIFVSLGLACSSAPSSPVTNITVSTGDLVPAFSPNITDYEVTSLTTLIPVAITVTGQDTTINGVVAKSGVAQSLTLTTLDDATVIPINAVDATGAPVTFKIHTVPAIRPEYNVTTNASPTPGHILVAPNQLKPNQPTPEPSFLEIYDETGKLEFYRKTNNPAFDFQNGRSAAAPLATRTSRPTRPSTGRRGRSKRARCTCSMITSTSSKVSLSSRRTDTRRRAPTRTT